MSIPVTDEDFAALGERFSPSDLVAETDRLAPLATADLAALSTRGYAARHLAALRDLRAEIQHDGATRTGRRSEKKGARKTEADALRDGKHLLRGGNVLAFSALADRRPAEGESPEQTRAIVARVGERIDALSGRVGRDSAKLRGKLLALRELLALPELAPHPDDAAARAQFLAQLDAALARLPDLAEAKKSLQQQARTDTHDLDALAGRLYFNLKLLTQAGRAYWTAQGNRRRASEYQLDALHAATGETPPPTGTPPAT